MLKVPGGAGAIEGGMCISACWSNRSRGREAAAEGGVTVAVLSGGGPPTSSTSAAEVMYSGYQTSSCRLNAGNSVDEDDVEAQVPNMDL